MNLSSCRYRTAAAAAASEEKTSLSLSLSLFFLNILLWAKRQQLFICQVQEWTICAAVLLKKRKKKRNLWINMKRKEMWKQAVVHQVKWPVGSSLNLKENKKIIYSIAENFEKKNKKKNQQ